MFILTPILGILSLRTYTKSKSERASADLEAARNDPSFIESLRKLTQSSEIEEYKKKKIMKRIESLERELMGIES